MKVETYSSVVVVGQEKRTGAFSHEDILFTSILYNYIDLCLMETRNIDWQLKVRRMKNKLKNRNNLKILGDIIEKSLNAINKRERFGDWEIATIIGLKKGDSVLLTFTERKTRYERFFYDR